MQFIIDKVKLLSGKFVKLKATEVNDLVELNGVVEYDVLGFDGQPNVGDGFDFEQV